MLAGSPDKHWQSLQLHQIESTPWFFQRSCCLVQASPTEESQPQICRPSEWSMATSDAFQTTSNYFSRWCVMGTPRAGKWIEGPLQHLYGTLEPWEEFVDVKSLPLSKEWAVDRCRCLLTDIQMMQLWNYRVAKSMEFVSWGPSRCRKILDPSPGADWWSPGRDNSRMSRVSRFHVLDPTGMPKALLTL